MQKIFRAFLLTLAVLLALCVGLASAQTPDVPETDVSLPIGTRFYPKASFPQLASYKIASQPDGADVESARSWLRLSAEGEYLLAGFDADGNACLNLRVHAVAQAPALLNVAIAQQDMPTGVALSFTCDAPYSFAVSCTPAADVQVMDETGTLLGVNGAQINVADEAISIALTVQIGAQSHRIPAQISLAYPCVACGQSPLSNAYNAENHLVGYCGHWLCLDDSKLHNRKCVCGEYLCNGKNHDTCACPVCGGYVGDGESHAACAHCSLRACDASYGDPARHIPCPHCGDIYCTLGWTSVIHEQCPHCGLWPCDDGYGYPIEHLPCSGCGLMACSDAYRADPYAHVFDPYCERYICAPDHPATCPHCGLSPCNPFYNTQDHTSICANCGDHLCAREHGFCKGCGKQLCDADFRYADHFHCDFCNMRICDPAYVPSEHAPCPACGDGLCSGNIHAPCPVCHSPLCTGDHSGCTATPAPTVQPTAEPAAEPTVQPTVEPTLNPSFEPLK